MSLLKNFVILLIVNILLTIACIAAIYFLGSSHSSFQLSGVAMNGLFILSLLAQLFVNFKILKALRIYSGLNYALCIIGMIAIWLCFIFYFVHRMQS
jgi:hypothetical protein